MILTGKDHLNGIFGCVLGCGLVCGRPVGWLEFQGLTHQISSFQLCAIGSINSLYFHIILLMAEIRLTTWDV